MHNGQMSYDSLTLRFSMLQFSTKPELLQLKIKILLTLFENTYMHLRTVIPLKCSNVEEKEQPTQPKPPPKYFYGLWNRRTKFASIKISIFSILTYLQQEMNILLLQISHPYLQSVGKKAYPQPFRQELHSNNLTFDKNVQFCNDNALFLGYDLYPIPSSREKRL